MGVFAAWRVPVAGPCPARPSVARGGGRGQVRDLCLAESSSAAACSWWATLQPARQRSVVAGNVAPRQSAAGDQDPGGPWHRLARSPDRAAVVPAPSCVFPACRCSMRARVGVLHGPGCAPGARRSLSCSLCRGFAAADWPRVGRVGTEGLAWGRFRLSLASGRRPVRVVLWRRGARTRCA